MQQVWFVSIGILLSALTSVSVAEESKENEGHWKGNVELGIVNTTGNTETEVINIKSKTSLNLEKWLHSMSFNALTSSDQGTTTAEKYLLQGQTDYKFNKHDYFLASITYENDRFSGYDYRISEVLGYGRRVIDEPKLTLSLEVGPGARQSKLETGGSDDEFIVRGSAKLNWELSETSTFTQDVKSEVGEGATITTSVTALTAQVNGSLATKITYTIKNTSDVPVGVAKTDTETAVTLVYSF